MNPEKAEHLSPELQRALGPLLREIESLGEKIQEYNQQIETLAVRKYPQVELLKQVKGVGTLIALTFVLTLEDPHRERPMCTERTNRSSRVRMEAWRQWLTRQGKTLSNEKQNEPT